MKHPDGVYMNFWRQATAPDLKERLDWLRLFATSSQRQLDVRAETLGFTINEEIRFFETLILMKQMGVCD